MFCLSIVPPVCGSSEPVLLVGSAALTVLYIVCLMVGGGLLLISTILGGHSDTSLDASSVHADVGTGPDVAPAAGGAHASAAGGHSPHEAASLSAWFSVQFLVYFVAVFGLVGTVLSYGSSVAPALVLGIAVGAGLLVGQGVHQTLRYVRRTSGNSTPTAEDYVNKLARVTLAIAPGQRGEIAFPTHGGEQYVIAVARHAEDRFGVGDRVGIVAYAGGTAEIVSQEEFEFLTDSESGAQT